MEHTTYTSDDDMIKDCRERDRGCQYLKYLKRVGLANDLYSKAGSLVEVLDVAHVFPKGAFPWMRHDSWNVVLLNRYTHSMIDQGKHPSTGKPITPLQREVFWFGVFQASMSRAEAFDRLTYLTNLSKQRSSTHGKSED